MEALMAARVEDAKRFQKSTRLLAALSKRTAAACSCHRSLAASAFTMQMLLEGDVTPPWRRSHILVCSRIMQTSFLFNAYFWAPQTRICDLPGVVRSPGQSGSSMGHTVETLSAVGFQRKEGAGAGRVVHLHGSQGNCQAGRDLPGGGSS